MRTSAVAILAAASAVSAQYTPAPKVTSNPAGAAYVATLPAKAGSSLAGSISAVTAPNGAGIQFSVSFSGLPTAGGPFIYHIHEKPVPTNGNCTGTGAHLDPYLRGETPPCDPTQPQTCQVGDLSGKYGNITTTSFSANYVDPFTSTDPSSNAFFGNLSFVVHLANKTRIGCANFTKAGGPAPVPSSGTALPGNATASVKPVSPTATQPVQFTGAAAPQVALGAGAMIAAAAAFVL